MMGESFDPLLSARALLGWFALAGVAFAVGGVRRPVAWRPILGGTALVFALGALVFVVAPARHLLILANDAIIALLQAASAGAVFLFGPLAMSPGEVTAAGEPSVGFVLATQVLPAIVFFASLMALAYHLGLVQPVIRLFARLFRRTLGLSGAESLAGAANLFVGVEAGLTVRPYLERMTSSELLLLLTCGMSTVASTTLALYVFMLQEHFPLIAGHLLSASLLSVPTAAVVAKLMLPEHETPETFGALPPQPAVDGERRRAPLAVLADGGMAGIRLAAGVAALLIAVLGLVAVVNVMLGALTGPLPGDPITVERVLGWLFSPLAFAMGIEFQDLGEAATLLGRRTVLTEVVAYQDLARLAEQGAISPRSLLMLSYAICGFAHVASIGVFVGGLTAVAPSRADELAALGPRALVGATLATLMTGALAGVFWTGSGSVLGLNA